MSHFPLYTALLAGLSKKDLTVPQKNDFIKKVATLNTEGHELIYALIKCYGNEHDNSDGFSLPYKGGFNKDKIVFDLLQLPNELRQLLYKFINSHCRKMEEDQQLSAAVASIADSMPQEISRE